jgi:hypothetical protein
MFNGKRIRVAISSLLFIFPNVSFSEWVYIADSERGAVYLDSKSRHRFDEVIEATILENLNTAENGSLSILSDVSYHCVKWTMTVMSIQRFSMANAKGKILSFNTYAEGGWRINLPVPKSSRLFPELCGNYTRLPNNK